MTAVLHLQVEDGTEISVPEIKALLAFVEGEPPESFGQDADLAVINARCAVIPPGGEFKQSGDLGDLTALEADSERALLINSRYETPSVFYLNGGEVSLGHINFVFAETTRFLLQGGMLRILGLSDVDATMLRLTHRTEKHQTADGHTIEELK
jgi:hypothetical protein